jgi:hypothetical protein
MWNGEREVGTRAEGQRGRFDAIQFIDVYIKH